MPDAETSPTPRPRETDANTDTAQSRDDLVAAEWLWEYLRLGQPVRPAQWLRGFGSPDLRVAQRAADLFRAGVADRVMVTGGA